MLKMIGSKQLIEIVFDYDAVLIPIGINNSFNTGFRYEVKVNFPEVVDSELKTNYGDKRKYGTVTYCKSEGLLFCLCHIIRPYKKGCDTVDYEALEKCLNSIKETCKGLSIISPILGEEIVDGNGNREKIISILEKANIEGLTIYDYKQRDYKLEVFRRIAEMKMKFTERKIQKDEYHEMRRRLEWERKNGIYKEMPEDYKYVPNYLKENGKG